MAPVAGWIRKSRESRGWTQADLARRVGASQAQVSHWETGRARPAKDLLDRLRRAFGDSTTGAETRTTAGVRDAGRKARERPDTTAAQSGRQGTRSAGAPGGELDFRAKLWQAADKLRGHMDAAEYKHVVLGLIFLKYISDAFAERRARLLGEVAPGADPEDPDEYRAENVFWVPKEARWEHLQAHAKSRWSGSP